MLRAGAGARNRPAVVYPLRAPRRSVERDGAGLLVYRRRPFSCRNWSCLWLLNDWAGELRPDRCGFVFDEVDDLIRINGVEKPCVQVGWRRAARMNGSRIQSIWSPWR
jgi:hypothetical protein